MGRPPLPTKEKVLKGTFRPDRSPQNEPAPPILPTAPEAPSQLNRWAKQMWHETAKELMALGMITTLDTYSLEILCEQYGIYREMKDAITHVATKGGKRKKISIAQYLCIRNSQTMPEYNSMRGAFECYKGLLREFGLSPASRSRINLPAKAPTVVDEMERLLEAK